MFQSLRPSALATFYIWLYALLGGVTYAEQPTPPRHIGVLQTGTWSKEMVQIFRQSLSDLGYQDGRDLAIDWRYANGDYSRVPELMADLVQSKVDLIVADSTIGTRAAKNLTKTIPIVMTLVSDPVGSGLVTSLAHPGGNITGGSIMAPELIGKRLQLLKETIPQLSRVAVLWNPGTPFHPRVIDQLKAEAPSLSIELTLVSAETREELGLAFSSSRLAHSQAVYVIEDGLGFTYRSELVKLASKARIPTMYWQRNFADEGGLMSYGANLGDSLQRAARYVDKILKGAKPGDLPIEQPTKFELVINLKAAKALGLTIPQSVLMRADEFVK